jgi:hypothetical protein
LAPTLETTQPEHSSSPTFSTSPENYRYGSYDSGVAALTEQFGALNYSQGAHGKGKATDTYNGITTHVLYVCELSGIITDFTY